MTRDHAAIEELLAVRALDGLDGDDVQALDRMLAEHGDCETCRELEATYAETASMLAATLDPVDVDPAIADAIVATPRTAAPPVSPVPTTRRSGRGWAAIVAVAAVVVLVVGSVAVLRDRSPATSVNWAQRVVAFEGTSGELAMAYVPGEPGVVVWGDGVPQPGEDRTLEIWMIEGGEAIRGACLVPTDGRVAAFLDADVSQAEVMAVTVESSACPDAPTTDPIFTAELA